MDHDYDKQMAETELVFQDIRSKHDLPEKANIGFQFMPEADPDWPGFEHALKVAGYTGERVEDEDGDWIEVTVWDANLSFDTIWHHEKTLTEIALERGFSPDGWGFFTSPGDLIS